MSDYVIDTNVLLAASTADPGSPFAQTNHLTATELTTILQWLREFRVNKTSNIILDDQNAILGEYRRKLRMPDLGLLVVLDKIPQATYSSINLDSNGHAELPDSIACHVIDRSDRKFVAVALPDPQQRPIVNACDSDWRGCEVALGRIGIQIIHLIP